MQRSLRSAAAAALVALAALGQQACRFDSPDRWLTVGDGAPCEVDELRCFGGVQRCVPVGDGATWQTIDDCTARGAVCSDALKKCVSCQPAELACEGADVSRCRADGSGFDVVLGCDTGSGQACDKGACHPLCEEAETTRSNVGCEYWAVDLDNANVGATNNAAAQQFAVVVSNPQTGVAATVTITQDDGVPGGPQKPVVVATGKVLPRALTVFKLGPREVDGSPDGEFDTGTGTALTRHAYRIQTSFPVVAYQFNPLDNAAVFSNDASLLKPVSALGPAQAGGPLAPAYVVVGWPQTIAHTDDPSTNFDPNSPIDLRAFLTIVGTREATKIRVKTRARVIPGGGVKDTPAGGVIEATLDPFDVLNLETGGFNADFTGSIIEANGPVVVFSGSEASDAPFFKTLSERFCCADHLEEQLDPIRTAGTHFVAAHGPSRTRTVVAAGAATAEVPEPDYFRVVAALDVPTTVKTTLPAPDDQFVLAGRGDFRNLATTRDFMLTASAAVVLGNVSPSQEAAGIRRGLPGGDPSLIVVPPIEQWRSDYVFLTPDKYAFDFITVVAKPSAKVKLDGDLLDDKRCVVTPADGLDEQQRGAKDPPYVVYTCQLSFATIDPKKEAPDNLTPGDQNDGVHRITSDTPAGLLVSGFDSFVSYGYAGGTDLREIQVE